jgi:hypothetical protein
VGLREITGPPTNGLFVIISQIPVKFDFEFTTYEFPVPDETKIKRLFPEAKDDVIKKSKGDLRFVIQSFTIMSDEKDDFQGARDFIESLVSVKSSVNPFTFLGNPVHEPGNVAAILHENYVDSKKCKPEDITRHMSDSVIFEDKIYEGNWELYPYYNLMGCILPAVEIGHSLKPPLRPGSVWTKHQSACAREKRLVAVSQRVPGRRITMDEILMLRFYADQGNVDILKEYHLKPQDLDVMNHLTRTKMKVKHLTALKKELA